MSSYEIFRAQFDIETPPADATIPDETDLRLSADKNVLAGRKQVTDIFARYDRPPIQNALKLDITGPKSIVSAKVTASNGTKFVGIAIWRYLLAQTGMDPLTIAPAAGSGNHDALFGFDDTADGLWGCAVNAIRFPTGGAETPVPVPHNTSVMHHSEAVPTDSRDAASQLFSVLTHFPGSQSATALTADTPIPTVASGPWKADGDSTVDLYVWRQFLMVPVSGAAAAALQQEGAAAPADGTLSAKYAGLTAADCDAVRAALTTAINEAAGDKGTVSLGRIYARKSAGDTMFR